jgi:flagellar export protein FliJ
VGKDLHNLIRLGKWNVDEKRRNLGILLTREEQIIAVLHKMQQELDSERANLKINMATAHTWPAFYDNWRQRKYHTEKLLEELRKQIEAMRDELSDAFRELKAFEAAQASRDRREQEERDRKERIFLDEIGLQGYRRRQGEG